jgi:hypothetical protein
MLQKEFRCQYGVNYEAPDTSQPRDQTSLDLLEPIPQDCGYLLPLWRLSRGLAGAVVKSVSHIVAGKAPDTSGNRDAARYPGLRSPGSPH